jgi:MFS transporter, OPA family, glycerol-3-phosphate transporter
MNYALVLLLVLQISTILLDLQSLLLLLTLGGISFIYFSNNPVGHDRKFRIRNWVNWLPMGLLYAFLYMGRYNLTVSKIELGNLMSKEAFGDIFAAGTVTYAFAFLINGPLVDRIGGKLGMLIGGIGAALANIAMGVLTYLLLNGKVTANPTPIFAALYSINMYFQSYGAVSICKVNAHWFHVKERGVFSGVFGTLISLGIFFAFSWSQAVVNATKLNAPEHLGFFERILRSVLFNSNATVNQTWFVFFVPAALLIGMVLVEVFLLKDTPKEAGLGDFDTADASSGEMDEKFTVFQIIKKVLTNPIILTIAVIEFCSGAVRNGIMHWYPIFAAEHVSEAGKFFKDNWGALLFLAGSYGGFFTGVISDKLFQSRRGPSATFGYAAMFLCVCVMAFALRSNPWALGAMAIVGSFFVIGIHGILSGTATMDFAGRRGTATAVGIVDGFVYLGTSVQSLCLGRITTYDWTYWPIFLVPFTILGTALAIKIWKAFPQATRKAAH